MKKYTVEELLNLWLPIIKDGLISIELSGSSVLPWIKAPADKDIIFIYETSEKARKAHSNLLKAKEIFYLPRSEPMDLHFKTSHLLLDVSSCIYGYETHFSIPYLNFKSLLDKIDILTNGKENYIQNLKKYYLFIKSREQRNLDNYKLKQWYHIYTGLCILDNNSYNLTEEQIQNINILHDKVEGSKELIDYCINRLEKI